jgi:hypothetical protein
MQEEEPTGHGVSREPAELSHLLLSSRLVKCPGEVEKWSHEIGDHRVEELACSVLGDTVTCFGDSRLAVTGAGTRPELALHRARDDPAEREKELRILIPLVDGEAQSDAFIAPASADVFGPK